MFLAHSIVMDSDKHIVFVDLQGFMVNQQFVLKELCISSSSTSSPNINLNHYIYKSPFSYKSVNHTCRKNILWLSNFHHGLYWNDGNILYDQIDDAIEQLYLPQVIIYVKGAQKIIWLRNLCKRINIDCRNIEDIGCNFRLADCVSSQLDCSQHRNRTNNCALQSVKLISNWYYNDTKHYRQQKTSSERTFPKCSEKFHPSQN